MIKHLKSIFFLLVFDDLDEFAHEFGERMGFQENSGWVLLLKIVCMFPLVNIILIGHSMVIVIEMSLSNFNIVKSDSS